MIRILFVIPYKEGEAVVQEVLAEKAYKKQIQYETLVAGVGERLTISQDRADAIISRGYTAATLKTVQPKIELRVTGFDIVRAVKECIDQYKCKKIAVIGTFHMVYGADSIQDLFDNAQVQCVTLEQEELLLPTMKKLQKQGTDAFIGGRSLYNTAKAMGISAVLLGFGREAVNKSIDEAIRAVEISRSEKAKSHRIQTIMDYAFEGILSADSQGTVVMANQYAANVLSGEKTEIIDYFTEVVTAYNGFSRKPSPESMLYLKEKYQIDNCLVIGDRDIDKQAGESAGFDTLLVDGSKSLMEIIE